MIYLDNAATTRIDDEVLDEMLPYLKDRYGNPGAIYGYGLDAAKAISVARERVSKVFSCEPDNIIFTSGGSEGNNTVINGIRPFLSLTDRKIIVSSAVEHDSILNALKWLQSIEGFAVDILGVNSKCTIDTHELESRLTYHSEPAGKLGSTLCNVGLVSIMYVNNETGAVNPIEEIGRICNERNVLFHTDCVQAAGMFDLDVFKLRCDFATISSHKIHGPKGVGALYVNKHRNKLVPIISGGREQEFGYRGGTENVAGIVGFGKACEIMLRNMDDNKQRINKLSNYITYLIQDYIPNARVNCFNCGKIINVTVPGVDTQSLIVALSDDVAISAGSACAAHDNTPSHVLKAIGLSDEDAFSTFRISISKDTDEESAVNAIKIIKERIDMLKAVG